MDREHNGLWENLLDNRILANVVGGHVGVDADVLTLTRCATGKFNTTWFVEGADRPLVLRVAPPEDRARMLFYEHLMMRQEPELHARIAKHTSVPIPAILAHDFGHRSIDRDYLLMERMPGTPLSDLSGMTVEGRERVMREVGESLHAVHAIHETQHGYIGPHAPMEPQDTWQAAFAIMWEEMIRDIERCGGYTTDEASMMRKMHADHVDVFTREVPASLLHMDVWSQNILADDAGRMTCLLDWDRALYGDPEIEFAVLDYCGISTDTFWEGYGSTRDRSRDAEIRRVFYLLYEIQKYIVIERQRRDDPSRADAYRRQSLQLASELR